MKARYLPITMKPPFSRTLFALFLFASFAVFKPAHSSGASANWTGASPSLLWSNSGSWQGGVLPSGNDVFFGNLGAVGDPNQVTSIVDQSLTVSSLNFNTSLDHLLQLNAGVNLNVTGSIVGSGNGVFSIAGGGTVTTASVAANAATFSIRSGTTLAVTSSFSMGNGGSGALNFGQGSGLKLGTATQAISSTIGSGSTSGTATLAIDSAVATNSQIYLSTLSIGAQVGTGTVDLSNYTGPIGINSLSVGGFATNSFGILTARGTGNFTFGNSTINQLTIPTVDVLNGSLSLNPGATLSVTSTFSLGNTGTGTVNFGQGSGLKLGTAAQPISATVGTGNIGGTVGGTATLAIDSAVATNSQLYLSTLSIGSQVGTGTVDLSNYTGPIAINSLSVGGFVTNSFGTLTGRGTGNFTFGNSTINQLTIPTVNVLNGSLSLNPGATLSVTSTFSLGNTGTGTVNFGQGSGLKLGTAAQPISATIGSGRPAGTATLAINSAVATNSQLYLSTLSIGAENGTGTVDLSNYTGPLGISSLVVGGYTLDSFGTLNGRGTGQFTFGNGTLNQLTVPTVNVLNGALSLNPGATLSVTSSFSLGNTGTGAVNLGQGSGLKLGTAAQPISATIGGGRPGGTASLAIDSTVATNSQLYFSTLSIGAQNGTGTVDLSNYTGPLSISSLSVGGFTTDSFGTVNGYGTGHFIFGNATLNQLTIPNVTVTNGDITVNSGSTLKIGTGLTVAAAGEVDVNIGSVSGGLWIDNISNSALQLSGSGAIMLNFTDGSFQSGTLWGLLWRGNHVAQLESLLNAGTGGALPVLGVNVGGSGLDINDLEVGNWTDSAGNLFTFVGFTAVPEPADAIVIAVLSLLLACAFIRRRYACSR